MKTLDLLHKELAELKHRRQYQQFEFERFDNENDETRASIALNRITELTLLIGSKRIDILNLTSGV